MAKYRFKTKEEFIRDGEWFTKRDTPIGWNDAGRMNHFLGQDIPERYNSKCDNKMSLFMDDWHFASSSYVLKETKSIVPEYAECVQECPPYYGEKGKIYKVKVWNYSDSDCMLEGTTSGSTSRSRFKPSTKEAYDAQNAPVVNNTPTFEVGKWYKYNNWYIKYKEHDNGFWTSSEEIDDDKNYRKCQSSFGGFKSDYKKILLTDLSEIQPYLPDGHPDKFPIAEQKMFKKGDYIVYLSEGTALLLKNYCYKQSQDADYLRVEKDVSGVKNGWPLLASYKVSRNWRYATSEEIAEYNRLDKPYDVTILFQEKTEQKSFPQYVRLISDKNGEVYKVEDWTSHEYCVIKSKSGKRLKPFKDLVSEAQEHEYHAITPSKKMKKTVDFKSLKFEEWLEETKKLNLSLHDLQKHINYGYSCDFKNVYSKIPGNDYLEKAQYLFDLWNSEKQSSMPKYVKCINSYGNAVVGQVYCTDDDKVAKMLFHMTWEQVLIHHNHFGKRFISATYHEYSEHHSEPVKEDKPIPNGYPVKKETLIEDVHSVSVMLCTKNKSKQFKF